MSSTKDFRFGSEDKGRQRRPWSLEPMNTLGELLNRISIGENELGGRRRRIPTQRKLQLTRIAGQCIDRPIKHKIGRITQKLGNNLVVDFCFLADQRDIEFEAGGGEELVVGDKVTYSVYGNDFKQNRLVRNLRRAVEVRKCDLDGGWFRNRLTAAGGYVGCVTSFDGQKGLIDNSIDFDRSNFRGAYCPSVQDWVICESSTTEEKPLKFTLKPNRVIQTTGPFRDCGRRYAFVGNVVFVDKHHQDISFIRDGDSVFAVAVESDTFQHGWRAVGLVRMNDSSNENVIGRLQLDDCQGILEMRGFLYCSFDRRQCSLEISLQNGSTADRVKVKDLRISSHGPFRIADSGQNRFPFIITSESRLVVQIASSDKFDFNASSLEIELCTQNSKHCWRRIVLFQDDFTASAYIHQSMVSQLPGKDSWRRYTQGRHRAHNNQLRMRGNSDRPRKLNYSRLEKKDRPPDALKNLMYQSGFNSKSLLDKYPYLQNTISWQLYERTMHTLLHIEQITVEIQAFQSPAQSVVFKEERGESLLSFQWPFNEDQLVSVMINDKILVDEEYEGFIHRIENERVFAKFEQRFLHQLNETNRKHGLMGRKTFSIRLIPDMSVIRRCHEAVTFVASEPDFEPILFPRPNNKPTTTTKTTTFEFLNQNLNEKQREAVGKIIRGSKCRSTPPFLLFGPPGTGKTVTLVEAIAQVIKSSSASKILACAPSNSACDLICERLIETNCVPKTQIARIYAKSRNPNDIPESLAEVKVHDREIEPFLRRRIIVSTFSNASMLTFNNGDIPGFTHLFLDECAQASEPEALIPLRMAGGKSRQIVMSGDPYQLGTVIKSKEASDFGLGRSLMQRLMDKHKDVYADNSEYFLDLVNTYRFSHECLIKTSSRMFYKDRLVVVKNIELDELKIDEKTLKLAFPRGTAFPLSYVKVAYGLCERCPVTMSCFNMAEAGITSKYFALFARMGIPISQIGIITPYRKQIQVIRNLLNEIFDHKTVSAVKIGTAEQFQGDERTVIIVSTVRSNVQNQKNTSTTPTNNNTIGFLHCPKRFNVSMTRAKRFMVIIGDGNTISTSAHWKSIIDFCTANKSVICEGKTT